MAEFRNVFVYVSDALRFDSVPDSIESEGKVVPTLAPAGYTPISFSSLVTGLSPENHQIRSFYDELEESTILDSFENSVYFDNPDGAMKSNVFKKYSGNPSLREMEEPFIYIERALDTHEPYGQVGHGNVVPNQTKNYGSVQEGYREGLKSTEEHFWSHIEDLEEVGLLEDTLVIFTSDHGEFLGERHLGRERHGHNFPLTRELCVVPTVFLNYEVGFDRMRTIDIAPTAAHLTGREYVSDGLILTKSEPKNGRTVMQINQTPMITTSCKWKWKDKRWKRSISGLKTDIGTLLATEIKWRVRSPLKSSALGRWLLPSGDSKAGDDYLEDLDF